MALRHHSLSEDLGGHSFGAVTAVIPKYISPVDPAARWRGAYGSAAYFIYSTNDLVELDNAVVVDVETTAALTWGFSLSILIFGYIRPKKKWK
ncbi:hypothetical protein FGG78_28575 [Thioclava sp. BHET1]|nr:hypothetical protein FGG78_28575 [Thioclava sp. BHET1]